MKALLSTAGALALIATSAAANGPGDRPNANSAHFNNTDSTPASVTLKAEVFEYIAVWGESDAEVLEVDGVTGVDGENNNNTADNATFNVTSNVTHDIELGWDTWGDASALQADYRHTDDSCSIGGTVNLDTNPGTAGGIEAADTGNASLSHENAAPTWLKSYGIAAEVTPNITDCPGDIAAPGDYSLDVEITVSKATGA